MTPCSILAAGLLLLAFDDAGYKGWPSAVFVTKDGVTTLAALPKWPEGFDPRSAEPNWTYGGLYLYERRIR